MNYYRAGSGEVGIAKPIFNDTRIDFGFEMLRDRQQKVKEAFYIDRLNLAQNDRMTTVEVKQHIQEQLRFMGPMLGRNQTEFLKPLLDRVLDIAIDRDGGSGEYLGDVPPEIQNVDIQVMYTSPIARAQRIGEADALTSALAASAPMLQVDPSSADVLDPEQVVREYFQIYGAPQKVLRTKRAIDMVRQVRQEAQQKVLQQQQTMHDAEVANKVAPLINGQQPPTQG